MLVIGLDGYGYELTRDAEWLKRFDYFGKLQTCSHTIPSNCQVLTGHGTHLCKYMWDGDGDNRLFKHEDLQGPFLWEMLSSRKLSQAWISFPLMNPVVKLPKSLVIGGILARNRFFTVDSENVVDEKLLEAYELYFHKIKPNSEKKTLFVKLLDLEFEIYKQIHGYYDFTFLYVFWLDPANHNNLTVDVKAALDKQMMSVPLDAETLVYSDHGLGVGNTDGCVVHSCDGFIAVKGNLTNNITSIEQIHSYILEKMNMPKKKPRRRKKTSPEPEPEATNTVSSGILMPTDTTETTAPTEEKSILSIQIPIKVHCPTCLMYMTCTEISVDPKGAWLFNLQCGHQQAFEFKVEMLGNVAVYRFGRL